jgi:PAS domain S-box-containing protein
MVRGQRLEASLTDDGRYRLLVESVFDYAIYMLDPTGIVTSWNAGARRFKGYEASEIIGQHFSRFYTDEDRAANLPRFALDTAAAEGKFEQEGWRVRKDGTRMWAHVVIDPIRGPAGEIVGFAKITRDLTERKAAETSLVESERQFRLLVQGVTDYAIYMLDPTGRVSSWNIGAQRIKGYLPAEIIGEHFSRFYTTEDRQNDEPAKALAAAASTGRYENEAWHVRKDGSRFMANIVIDAIHDDEGALIGFAKITRDVTDQRKAQRELEQAREALFQAQKMEAIGQLTGGIAHDFNNILMAIISGLELLKKRIAEDPRSMTLLDNTIHAAERGASVTQRMLAFARRQELTQEVVDIPDLVAGLAGLLEQSLGPSVTTETHFPVALAPVDVDPNQLELAILNLVVNARDSMSGGGSIVVAARPEEVRESHPTGLSPGAYVCLSLTDTGDGMDPETLARATEPFYTTKGVGKGTGLGLSMVHGLAEQSGGRLVLKSRRGAGTTAEIWLPVAAVRTEPSGTSGEAIGQPPPSAPRPLAILIVDDDPIILRNTAAMLEDLGHTVFEAGSAREALEIVRQGGSLDLLITDQLMPEMTGLQLIEAIRADAPDLPVILATGYADLERGNEPIVPRLSKPFRQDELAKRISSVVRPISVTA